MKTEKQKKLIVVLVILILIFISAAFSIPKLLDLNQYKGWIASQIEEAAQGEVNIGHITWGISNGIWLRTDAFSITDASSFPVDLHLTDIYIKLAVLPLLSKKIEIEELTLDGLGVVVKLKPETAVSDDKTSTEILNDDLGALLPVMISMKKLSIQNGRIRIENGITLPGQRIVHTFNDVKIDATDIIPGEKIDFHLSLEGDEATGLGSLQAHGSFKGLMEPFIIQDPKIKLNTLISSLDTEIFKPYLKKTPLDNKLKGLVSLEINYEGDLLSHFNVKGSVNLTKTTYHDPSLWEGLLPGVETVISYQADIDPHDIRIADLSIVVVIPETDKTQSERFSIKLNGRIDDWQKEPGVLVRSLSTSPISLKPVVSMIPWEQTG
ncbi:MAG: hypothetical protein DRH93_01635, partial [Deltaproteobacteria bacterium]